MRKLLKFNTLLVAGITSVLLVGFQNCSKYQYAAVDVAAGSNNGLNTDTLPDNSSNDVNQVGGSAPVIGSGGSTTPSGDGTKPPVIGDGHGGSTPKPPSPDNEECISEGKKCYVDEEDDENDLEAYCNKKYTSGKSSAKNRAAAAVEIIHRRGKMIITQDNIAHINLIEDFRGKLILCGVTIDKICNTRGSIVLVDSKVDQMEDHKGNIKIIGSASSPSVSYSKTKINVERSR